MDTSYWGPSAWQLFHTIAFKSPHPEEFLKGIKDIMPCKFCRESSSKFMKELPLKGDAGKWLYELHNKVNNKLRTQCRDDPQVINPGDDPLFEDVKAKYMALKPTGILGRDFLFSVSANFPEEPSEADKETQSKFIYELEKVYPFKQSAFKQYVQSNPPALESRRSYMKWMYGLLKKLGPMPSYNGYVQRVMYYKSGCDKKTYKGKTCRRLADGGRTKNRDHRRTKRISHQALL